MEKNNLVKVSYFIFLLFFINIFFLFGIDSKKINSESLNRNDTKDITEYKISKGTQSGNNVDYKVSYAESDVWFWDAEKSDFNPPRWVQKEFEKWEYSALPKFSLYFIGELEEEEEIPPAPYFSDWTSRGSEGDYTYTWNKQNQKASMPKIDKKNWDVTSKDDFNEFWHQIKWNKWGWENDKGTWSKPKRKETGNRNKDVWIDWNIKSNDSIDQSGNFNIFNSLKDIDEGSDPTRYNNENNQPHFDMDYSYDKNAPKLDIPEPKDGEHQGIAGDKTLKIRNLSLGWHYYFTANLNYKDKNGNTQTLNTYNDDFVTNREAPTDSMSFYSTSEDSITYSIKITDHHSSRISPIKWNLEDNETEETIDNGSNNSNYFRKTFFNLNKDNSYTLEMEYDYKLNDDLGKQTSSDSITGTTSSYYKNTVTNGDFSISNISKDEMTLNANFLTNNNIIDNVKIAGWTIQYTNDVEKICTQNIILNGDDITPGTNSHLFKYENFEEKIDYKQNIKVVSWINNPPEDFDEQDTTPKEYSLDTNTHVDYSIVSKNSNVTNREATINYILGGNIDNINGLQYSLNNSKWINIDFEKTSDQQSFYISGLNPEKKYDLKIRGVSNEYVIFANPFVFKTDRDTKMKITSHSANQNSITIVTSFDKYKYLDQKYFDWNIKEDNSGDFIKKGRQEILSNGDISTNIDELNPNTSYTITTNVLIENKIIPLDISVKTLVNPDDHINNGYITGLKKKSNDFKLSYVGNVKTVDYSFNGIDGWKKVDFNLDKGKINLTIPEPNFDEIHFRLNGSFNSLYSWHSPIENDLVLVKHHPYINVGLLVFFLVLIFITLTISLSIIWAKWWKSREVKPENINIWENIKN